MNWSLATASVTAVLLLLGISCGSIEDDAPEMTDTERLQEIGMLWGLEWPRADGLCTDDILVSTNSEWLGFRYDFHPSYGVTESRLPHPYNSHQALEASFQEAGGWRIEIGEMELVRERVERWRESYVSWVQDAEKYANLIPNSQEWSECKHMADTIAHRGRRALNHIDALLR